MTRLPHKASAVKIKVYQWLVWSPKTGFILTRGYFADRERIKLKFGDRFQIKRRMEFTAKEIDFLDQVKFETEPSI